MSQVSSIIRPASADAAVSVAISTADQFRALILSLVAFTISFAVWTVFGIVGLSLQGELGLNQTEFGLLVALPVLTGSISRPLLGICTDRYGGRGVFALTMLASAACAFALPYAGGYLTLLGLGLGLGLAGGTFAIGIAYVSRWFPQERQGTALGIFGAGTIGAALTIFFAPFVMVAFGWTAVVQSWAVVLAATAVLFWLVAKDDPARAERRRTGAATMSLATQLAPLRKLQVWRFGLYYFLTFGGFVALSLWLPRYYVGVYHLDITTAGMLATAFSLPAGGFRALGGWLADRFGARRVMYWTFGCAVLVTFVLSYPATDYIVHGINRNITFTFAIGFVPFAALTALLGIFLAFGMGAVYKHIPHYYPQHIGPVGGVVGMIGGLGGFVLPVAFGAMNDLVGVWTSCFMLLFLIAVTNITWMHFAIRRMERKVAPQLYGPHHLPELEELEMAGRSAIPEL
ncbi:MAG: nitrate/nitrite transporter [Alphaproteobacteria bacterium]